MYAFAERDDTRVIDEPLYAHYLRVSGANHPGRDDVLASQDNFGPNVVRDVIFGPCDRPILFVKQMGHHVVDLDLDFTAKTTNAFLVRDPKEMLPSLINQVPEPDLNATGLSWQSDLHRRLVAAGETPVVLDAREVLLDPARVLEQACIGLGIEYDKGMTSWEAGPRKEDGVWAPHWYHNVHKSTGFGRYTRKEDPFPERLRPLLEECIPHYNYLYQFAIRADNVATEV